VSNHCLEPRHAEDHRTPSRQCESPVAPPPEKPERGAALKECCHAWFGQIGETGQIGRGARTLQQRAQHARLDQRQQHLGFHKALENIENLCPIPAGEPAPEGQARGALLDLGPAQRGAGRASGA
jgi:hypothetical protein